LKRATFNFLMYIAALAGVTLYYQLRLVEAQLKQRVAERALSAEMTRAPRRCYKREDYQWIVKK